MRSLLIESSTERGVVALFEGEHLIEKIVLPFGYQNSRHLLPEIEKLLQKNGTTVKQLAFVTAGIGPGSYTGMRIGVMVAKALTYAVKIPLVGVSSLEGFVPEQNARFAAIIDAKIGGAYFLIGQKTESGIQWESLPQVAELTHIVGLLESIPVLVSPVVATLKIKMEKLACTKWDWLEKDSDPIPMIKKSMEKYRAKEYSEDGSLELLYLRKTQAEIELKERNRLP
jgi:tRNA threonylcarbamoyladenosine biosynthesis protein TsaB